MNDETVCDGQSDRSEGTGRATSCPHCGATPRPHCDDVLDEVLAEVRRTRTVLAERIQEFYDHFDGMTSDM